MNDLIELGETIKRRNIEIALKRNPTAAAEVARLKARIAELEAQLAAATSAAQTKSIAQTHTPKAKRSAK